MASSKLFTIGLAVVASLGAAYPSVGDGAPTDRPMQPSEQCTAAMTATCPACPLVPKSTDGAMGQQGSSACAAQCASGASSECLQCVEAMAKECRQCVEGNEDSLIAAGCTHVACMRLKDQVCPVCATKGETCRLCRLEETSAECASCEEARTACHSCMEQNSSEFEGQCGGMGRKQNASPEDMAAQPMEAASVDAPRKGLFRGFGGIGSNGNDATDNTGNGRSNWLINALLGEAEEEINEELFELKWEVSDELSDLDREILGAKLELLGELLFI